MTTTGKKRDPRTFRADGIRTLTDIRDRCTVDPAGCWVWKFSVVPGTKAPQTRYKGRITTARRVALELIGKPVQKGFFAVCKPGCHELCVHPYHLLTLSGPDFRRHLASIGAIENAMHQAARTACVRARDTTKLTRDGAEAIRHRVAAGEDRGALATEFGVSRNHINRVARGVNWAPAQEVRGSSVFAWCGSMGGEQ